MNDEYNESSQHESQEDESESGSDYDSVRLPEENKVEQLPKSGLKRGHAHVSMPPLKKIIKFKLQKVFTLLINLP